MLRNRPAKPSATREGAKREGAKRDSSTRSGSSAKATPERRQTSAQSAKTSGIRSWFEHHQGSAVDSLLRLLAEPLSSLLTWSVIGIALALPLCLFLLLENLQHTGSSVNQISTITLYLNKGQSPAALDTFRQELAGNANVAEVLFITADEALDEFEKTSGFGDVLGGLDANPLPPVLLVTPVASDEALVAALHAQLQQRSEVEFAQLDLQWLQRLNAILALASRLAMLLALLLGIGVVLAIGNTVRLAIENRRAEIVVVKLVGATDAYVARPFLYTGLWYGVGGGLLALLLITAGLFLLDGPVSSLTGSYGGDFTISGLGLTGGFLVIVCAALLGWVGAWISVLRHLRSIEPR